MADFGITARESNRALEILHEKGKVEAIRYIRSLSVLNTPGLKETKKAIEAWDEGTDSYNVEGFIVRNKSHIAEEIVKLMLRYAEEEK